VFLGTLRALVQQFHRTLLNCGRFGMDTSLNWINSVLFTYYYISVRQYKWWLCLTQLLGKTPSSPLLGTFPSCLLTIARSLSGHTYSSVQEYCIALCNPDQYVHNYGYLSWRRAARPMFDSWQGKGLFTVKLITHIYLVPRLSMCTAVPPLRYTSSRRGA
jgi:hypothetical protein